MKSRIIHNRYQSLHCTQIEISIVRLGWDEIHAEGISYGEDAYSVGHDTFFVEGGVAVEDDVVTVF